uniref:ORF 1a/1b fusion polyprotein n=2 Tax=Strawberry pallidosis-associated virus TaxID=227507 RepID=A0A7G9U709_9CLOS|nr:ORF 1a/1b fusion polyprotein [Strawberry pallidosis-associated virus]
MSVRSKLVSPFTPSADIEFSSFLNRVIDYPIKSIDLNRLDFLRQYFNIPLCRFNKLPKPIVYMFGRDFQAISNFIDQKMSLKTGNSPNPGNEVVETIEGKTAFGDGYFVRVWEKPLVIDVFVSLGRYHSPDYDYKYRLNFRRHPNNKRIYTSVMCNICKADKVSKAFCENYNLFSVLNPTQFMTQCLLLSVVEKIQEFKTLVNYHVNSSFRQPLKSYQEKLAKYNEEYRKTKEGDTLIGVKSNVKGTETKKSLIPQPFLLKKRRAPFASVRHHVDVRGREYFTICYTDGSVKYVPNHRNVIVNMFNLTLGGGTYVIHEMCLTPDGSRYGMHKNGYCWLEAFCMANRFIPRHTVPFPELKYGYLLSCGLRDIMKGRIEDYGNGLGHFSRELTSSKREVYLTTHIGIKTDGEGDISLKNADVFFDDLFSGIVNNTNVKSENDVMSNIVRRVSNKLNETFNRKKELNISVCLSSNEKKELCEIFPEICMEFSDSSFSSHALFTAIRECENYSLSKKNNFCDFIDAGGNVVKYIRENVKDIHVCAPVVDIKDSHRMMTRSNILDKTAGLSETITMCDKMCQVCDVQKQNIVAVEVYDMTLSDMAKSILSHKAKRFDFSVIIPPEVYEENCDVSMFGGGLRVKGNNLTCSYYYGKSGECYTHDINNLRDILKIQIFSVDGVIFKKTLESSRRGLHFFSIVPCLGMKNDTYTLKTYYPKTESDKVLMLVPVKNKFGIVENVRVKTDRSIVYHLLEYVMNTAQRIDEKSYEYLMSQFRARKSINIKGGKVIQEPFDLPLDLYPGYLGVILGEGLRLREKTLQMAKLSYFKHYLPTILRIMIHFMYRTLAKTRQAMYHGAIHCMKWIMSEEFIEEVINGDRRIFDIQETYEFSQVVTITGEEYNNYAINESFNVFVRESEKNLRAIDSELLPFDDSFETTELDRFKDLLTGGGGGFSCFSKTAYKIYERIFRLFSWTTLTPKKVHDLTGVLTNLIFYMLRCGSYTFETMKKYCKMVFNSITGIGCGLSVSIKTFLKDVVSLMRRKIVERNDKLYDEFMDNFKSDDELELSSMDSQTTLDANICSEEEVSSESDEVEVLCHDSQLSTLSFRRPIRCFISWRSLKSHLDSIFRYPYELIENIRFAIKSYAYKIYRLYLNSIEVAEIIKETFNELKDAFFGWLTSEGGLEFIIDGVSLSIVNTIFYGLMGRFSLMSNLAVLLVYSSLKLSGIGKKYLGHESIVVQLADFLNVQHPFGFLIMPVRHLAMKCISNKLKKKAATKESLKTSATSLIAKDFVSLKFYDKFSYKALRQAICILLIFIVIFPKLVLVSILSLLLIGEHKKYLNSTVLQANLQLSFASVFKKTSKSNRMIVFKKLIAEKFSRKKTLEEDEEIQQSLDIAGKIRDGDCVDDDIEVDFDYDGSYVERKGKMTEGLLARIPEVSKKDIPWGDRSEHSMNSAEYENLNFSSLTPTTDRHYIKCEVNLKLSNAILLYPNSGNCVPTVTGNMEVDAISEFYYLESRRMNIELGKLDNAIRVFASKYHTVKKFQDIVWDMRNNLDDSTLYMSNNGNSWYRLKQSDGKSMTLEGACKMTVDSDLVSFTKNVSGYQFTSDELLGMFTNNRCMGLESFKDDKGDFHVNRIMNDVVIHNKPPGAGKTTTIVKNILDDLKNRETCLAFTCTSAGKKEIVDKLKKFNVPNAYQYVTTYDAYLMKNKINKIQKVYCDEVFMVHAGEWVACMNLIDNDFIRCYGDKNQIPFINRVPNTTCHLSFDLYLKFQMIHDNVSYRCPVDVCYLLSNLTDPIGNKLYPNGVYPAGDNSKILRSVDVVGINCAEDLKPDEKKKYITFTQYEKEEVSKITGKKMKVSGTANTVNEVQGGTFPKVELIRLKQFDNPIYTNMNQFIVSISRHTEKLDYKVVSSKLNDFVGEKISALNTIADYVIKEHNFKQCVDVYEMVVEDLCLPATFSRPPSSHHRSINEFMCFINPGLSAYNYIHRTLIFEYEQYELPVVGEVDLVLSRSKPYNPGLYVIPDLLGKGERSRPDTWRQVLLSLSHRNFSAPRVNENCDTLASAEILAQSLMKAFDFLKLSENFDTVLPDIWSITKWIEDREPNKVRKLKRSFGHDLMNSQFSRMKLMIKGEMKPKMDMSSYGTYGPSSNIIYYEQVVNMFYSPMFLRIFDRIVYCLNSKVVLYSGMNLETLGKLIRSKLDFPIQEYRTTEIDFSKFDKSQGVIFKLYEEIIYKFFKFDSKTYEAIKFSEYFCRAKSSCGISVELGAQRRTGSPNTWLSNTLVTLAMILTHYDLDDIDLLLVSGDDSLIFSRKDLGNKANEINRDFGMEAKFIMNSVPYFCSKFIIEDRGEIKVVPDPVRFFEKLSVPISLQDFQVGDLLRERFVSFKDLMIGYDSDAVIILVDNLISIRYDIPRMTSYAALCYIHCLTSNVLAYTKLFIEGFTVAI